MRQQLLLAAAGISLCLNAGAQQRNVELATGYNAGVPLGEMQHTTGTLNALNFRVFYTPSCPHIQQCPIMSRMSLGLELNSGTYASFTKTQVFGFAGTETPTDVHYNSNVNSVNLILQARLLQAGNWDVAIGPKAGVTTFQSKIQIEDPHDQGGCEPMDTRNLISDYTWQAGGEASVTMDTRALFPRMSKNRFLIQARAGYLQGGNIDYINVSNRSNETDINTNTSTGDNQGTPINMRFVNVSTQEQHEHEVARVYNSPVKYFEAGLSLVVRF